MHKKKAVWTLTALRGREATSTVTIDDNGSVAVDLQSANGQQGPIFTTTNFHTYA